MAAFGHIIAAVAGFVQWLWFAKVLMDWLGFFFGFWLAIMCTPGLFIFPLIYKLVEGFWPNSTYFFFFALMWFGMILALSADRLTGEIDDF